MGKTGELGAKSRLGRGGKQTRRICARRHPNIGARLSSARPLQWLSNGPEIHSRLRGIACDLAETGTYLVAIDPYPEEIAIHPLTIAIYPLTIAIYPLTIAIHPLTIAIYPLTIAIYPLTIDIYPLETATCTLDVSRSGFS